MAFKIGKYQNLFSLLLPNESEEAGDNVPDFPYSALIEGDFDSSQLRFENWAHWQQVASRMAEPLVLESKRKRLAGELAAALSSAKSLEGLWVFPGVNVLGYLQELLSLGSYETLRKEMFQVIELMSKYGDQGIRYFQAEGDQQQKVGKPNEDAHYFTTLVVADIPADTQKDFARRIAACERPREDFVYNLLFVPSMADAIEAVLNNRDIQACIMWQDFPFRNLNQREKGKKERNFSVYIRELETACNKLIARYSESEANESNNESKNANIPIALENTTRGHILGDLLNVLRPQLHLYFLGEVALSNKYSEKSIFKRSFNRHDDVNELHMTLLDGVRQKYRTPFFDALKRYAKRPVGNFHALPIARGNSVFNSKWLEDMRQFYGDNIFLAESSATTGGLDSLLAPKGPIKEAQLLAAKTFGAKETFFITNGTSTGNKIVGQALLQPGDIVLIDRNCHKSHHYTMVLSGAHPIYLDAFSVEKYGIYGGIKLETITDKLKQLKAEGLLDRVKMLLLTNCTFDGVVYNPAKVMHEVLTIKNDICFLWDEAWFAYARLFPTTRQRTAMRGAEILDQHYTKEGVRYKYKLRVYATQSTHKSLSALRQGSMIHVYDELFESNTKDLFHEAYFTHTSTSPNYQILATLDLARRQVDFEGFPAISSTYQKAAHVRKTIKEHKILSKYVRALTPADLMQEFKRSDSPETAWLEDEFVLDPTRITLYTAKLAMGGDEFKGRVLMDEHSIQVNKTGINNVLFISTIGATWSGVHYLIDVLISICTEFEEKYNASSGLVRTNIDNKIQMLENEIAPIALPDFSSFHPAFQPYGNVCAAGNIRSAFYLDYNHENRAYKKLPAIGADDSENLEGSVCTNFIIPYPPGFPILVPGQVISAEVIKFMQTLDIEEIHGYDASLGLPVFTELALKQVSASVESSENKTRKKPDSK
ncbi:MAG: arginine decarboxylase [Candidatus Azotimanducaceae bacterium]|jgi:arginine decarboxylase